MSLFNKMQKEKRSIDDILTPKTDENAKNEVEVGESQSEKEAETTANESPKVGKKDIQIESPEEGSFNALTCFGWSETKTPKWLIKCAHFWYGLMSLFWFILGALTFAPIIFIQKKVSAIFKDKLKSLIVAAIIYGIFVALTILLIISRNAPTA